MRLDFSMRLKQGVRALFAFAQPLDEALVYRYLTPLQCDLFAQLGRAEQLHSIRVLQDVLTQDAHTPDDLAVAALLHDIGKVHFRCGVWQKTVSVALKEVLPSVERRLSTPAAPQALTFWRGPFMVRRHHPAWGAALLTETGANERVVWLVAHHQDAAADWRGHPHEPLLKRLQRADNAN